MRCKDKQKKQIAISKRGEISERFSTPLPYVGFTSKHSFAQLPHSTQALYNGFCYIQRKNGMFVPFVLSLEVFLPITNRGGGRKRYQKVVRFQKERTKENRQSVQKDGGLLIGF